MTEVDRSGPERLAVVARLRSIYASQRPGVWEAGDLVIGYLGPMDLTLKVRSFRLSDRDPKMWQRLRSLADEAEVEPSDLEKAWERASAWPPSTRDFSLPWKIYDVLSHRPTRAEILAEFLAYCDGEGKKPVGSVFTDWYDGYIATEYNRGKASGDEMRTAGRGARRSVTIQRARIPADAAPANVGAAVLEWSGGNAMKLRYIRRVVDGALAGEGNGKETVREEVAVGE